MLGPLLSPIGKECGRQSVRSLGFASKRIRCRVDVDEEYVQATSRMLSMSVTVRSKTTERKGARKRATEMREEGRGLAGPLGIDRRKLKRARCREKKEKLPI